MGWLTGYLYRKPIVIHGSIDGELSAYQVKLLVGKSSGATGEDVDCAGHCLDTFADLRFTNLAGTGGNDTFGGLDYWIESSGASGTSYLATVWIEVGTINDHAAGDGNTTIYLYYGNAGASAPDTSDNMGAATFLQYNAAYSGAEFLKTVELAASGGYRIRGRGRSVGSNSGLLLGLASNVLASISDAVYLQQATPSDGHFYTGSYKNGANQSNVGTTSCANNTYYNQTGLLISGTSFKGYEDAGGQQGATITDTAKLPDSSMGLWYYRVAGTGDLLWGWVGKYTANEPTWGDLTKGEEYFLPHFSFYPHILAH